MLGIDGVDPEDAIAPCAPLQVLLAAFLIAPLTLCTDEALLPGLSPEMEGVPRCSEAEGAVEVDDRSRCLAMRAARSIARIHLAVSAGWEVLRYHFCVWALCVWRTGVGAWFEALGPRAPLGFGETLGLGDAPTEEGTDGVKDATSSNRSPSREGLTLHVRTARDPREARRSSD